MDVATGATGSLLPKLGKLLRGGYKLQNSVKRDIEFLEKELRSMQPALRKLAKLPRHGLDRVTTIWASEVKELSYEMEDVIDTFLEHIEGSEHAANAGGFKGIMKKMANLFRKGKPRCQIANAIQGLKDQIQHKAAQRERYMFDVVCNPIATPIIDSRIEFLYKEHQRLVGIDGPRDELTKRLVEGGDDVFKKQLKMHSIFGFKGLGKTTLAWVVYRTLKEQFECGAFVSVGQNPRMKHVFENILFELDQQCHMDFQLADLDERQLIEEIRGLLQTKRYFIVIDDIWDIKAWQIIKCALIDNDHGSRIIITTRIFEVARKIGCVYKLQNLSRHNSEELLYEILFSGEGKHLNDQQAEILESLLKKCGGVPLAIMRTAELLASEPMENWSKVCTSIGFGHGYNQDFGHTREILSLSYYDLPFHLRTCLLYLSIFPEDYVIRKDTLIWKWVAEGFVYEEPRKSLFEVGARYFNELINRGLIQPVETPHQGITIGCRVHKLVLDLIYTLSMEEKFVTILDSSEQHRSSLTYAHSRRLAIQKSVIEQYDSLANIQTAQMRSFNATMCNFSMMPPLSSYLVLRVLALEDCTFVEGHLCHLRRLIQLRYLGVRNTPIHEIPEEIGDLRFLQTLDLRQTKIQELPSSVGQLRQLKCLLADAGSIRVSDWIGNLKSLEELSLNDVSECPNFVEELAKMTELRNLRIKRFNESSNKGLVESLRNLQKIQVLVLCDGLSSSKINMEGYVPTRQLRHLSIKANFSALPAWINSSFLPNLSHLFLALVKAVDAQDVETIGRLPELLSLSLLMPSNVVPTVMGGGAFRKLRYCNMSAPLRFLQGAMLSLESVQFIVQVRALKDARFDFDFGSLENLPCLQNVRVDICYTGDPSEVVEEAEASLRHVVDIHPNCPLLELTKSDKCDDQQVYFDFDKEDANNEHHAAAQYQQWQERRARCALAV